MTIHIPVLMDEVLDGLDLSPDSIIVDGTLGGAGHAAAILEKLGEKGRLIAFDRDPQAVELAGEKIEDSQSDFHPFELRRRS